MLKIGYTISLVEFDDTCERIRSIAVGKVLRRTSVLTFPTMYLADSLTPKLLILSKNQLDIQIQHSQNRLYSDFGQIW